MTLYLQSILSTKGSGVISIDIPIIGGGSTTIEGFLTEDVQFTARNEWGNIIPNLDSLTQLSQIVNSTDMLCWVAATEAGWKGTAPIDLNVEFYMYSIDKSSKIKDKAKALLKLAAMYASGATTVEVHGGYSPYYMQNNISASDNGMVTSGQGIVDNMLSSDAEKGTVTLRIGKQLTFRKLLLVQATTMHSNVEVAPGEPLYIKVNAQFRGRRALMVDDIDTIYG